MNLDHQNQFPKCNEIRLNELDSEGFDHQRFEFLKIWPKPSLNKILKLKICNKGFGSQDFACPR
jgi:hypothetical protein